MLAPIFVCIALALGQFSTTAFFFQGRQEAISTIEGRVVGPDSKPIKDAIVFLQNDGYSPVGSVYTDSFGRYRFMNIRSGIYYVQADPVGTDYERQTQRIDARSFSLRRGGGGGGEVFRMDFILRPRRIRVAPEAPKSGPGSIVFYQDVPPEAKKQYQEGVSSLEKNAFEAGSQHLTRAIQIFPNYHDALELLGTEYVKRGQYQNALPLLQQAVEVNRNSWRGFYSLGIAQMETQKRDEGTKSLRRAVELFPDSPNTNLRLAMALAQKETDRDEAIQILKKTVQILKKSSEPDKAANIKAHLLLAGLYVKNNQFNEAADALQPLVSEAQDEKGKEALKAKIKELRQKATEARK